jgi:hypothetical protein
MTEGLLTCMSYIVSNFYSKQFCFQKNLSSNSQFIIISQSSDAFIGRVAHLPIQVIGECRVDGQAGGDNLSQPLDISVHRPLPVYRLT